MAMLNPCHPGEIPRDNLEGGEPVGDRGGVSARLHTAGAVAAAERQGQRWPWRWSDSVGVIRVSGCGFRRPTPWRRNGVGRRVETENTPTCDYREPPLGNGHRKA